MLKNLTIFAKAMLDERQNDSQSVTPFLLEESPVDSKIPFLGKDPRILKTYIHAKTYT